jgi:hypothetical protein
VKLSSVGKALIMHEGKGWFPSVTRGSSSGAYDFHNWVWEAAVPHDGTRRVAKVTFPSASHRQRALNRCGSFQLD